jgi:hypothetical protein
MQAFTFLLSTLSLAFAAPTTDASLSRRQQNIASVDRYAGGGCTGTVCNIAGSGDLKAGCNVITDQCTASVKLNYVPVGCKCKFGFELLFPGGRRLWLYGDGTSSFWANTITVTIWTDKTCSSVRQFANVTTFDCYALGPPIGSISVVC